MLVKQSNKPPETGIHKVILDFIILIQKAIKEINIYKFTMHKGGISQQNS